MSKRASNFPVCLHYIPTSGARKIGKRRGGNIFSLHKPFSAIIPWQGGIRVLPTFFYFLSCRQSPRIGSNKKPLFPISSTDSGESRKSSAFLFSCTVTSGYIEIWQKMTCCSGFGQASDVIKCDTVSRATRPKRKCRKECYHEIYISYFFLYLILIEFEKILTSGQIYCAKIIKIPRFFCSHWSKLSFQRREKRK